MIKRLGALAFSAVYVHKHGSERAAALRVAHLAYRFLDGDDVDTINREADEVNAVREAETKRKLSLVAVKPHISKLRRLTRTWPSKSTRSSRRPS